MCMLDSGLMGGWGVGGVGGGSPVNRTKYTDDNIRIGHPFSAMICRKSSTLLGVPVEGDASGFKGE